MSNYHYHFWFRLLTSSLADEVERSAVWMDEDEAIE